MAEGAFWKATGRRNRRIELVRTDVCCELVAGHGPPWFCASPTATPVGIPLKSTRPAIAISFSTNPGSSASDSSAVWMVAVNDPGEMVEAAHELVPSSARVRHRIGALPKIGVLALEPLQCSRLTACWPRPQRDEPTCARSRRRDSRPASHRADRSSLRPELRWHLRDHRHSALPQFLGVLARSCRGPDPPHDGSLRTPARSLRDPIGAVWSLATQRPALDTHGGRGNPRS